MRILLAFGDISNAWAVPVYMLSLVKCLINVLACIIICTMYSNVHIQTVLQNHALVVPVGVVGNILYIIFYSQQHVCA